MTWKYVSIAEMMSIEKAADVSGYSYDDMMSQAGKNLAAVVDRKFQDLSSKKILALVGKGNNGGDALVALGHLQKAGWETSACLLGGRDPSDPLLSGIQIIRFDEKGQGEFLKRINDCALILDGILGTGLRLPLRQTLGSQILKIKSWIESIEPPPIIVAVDCPSGMDCDSGEIDAGTIRSDLTICMAAVKHGMFKFPAFEYLGELELVEIGLPKDFPPLVGIQQEVIDEAWVSRLIPERPLDSHKSTFGRAMVVGGSGQFIGAPVLAAHAALKSGVGWVVSALPESVVQIVAGNLLESTWLPLRSSTGNISKDNVSQIIENMDGVSSLLIGPGLPDDPETHEFIRAIVNPKLQFPPLVLDAGALRALKKKDLELLPLDTILTPHPGEMAALTGLDVKAVQLDRVGIAKKFAQAWNCVVVLKGAFTVVASSSGRVGILPVATPALAKAGTGDVLAGVIVGLRAQRMPAFDAAALAVWVHAKAALRSVDQVGGTAAVLPSTIIENIGWFLN